MPTETNDTGLRDAITNELRELGVSAPNHDTDAIAERVVAAGRAYGAMINAAGAVDVHASAPEATDAAEHADDAAGEATARDIASGKVVEPAGGGVVEPVDG